MKKLSSTLIMLIILAIAVIGLAVLYAYFYTALLRMGQDQAGVADAMKDAPASLEREAENKERLAAYFVAEGEEAAFVSSIEQQCRSVSILCATSALSKVPDENGATKVLGMKLIANGSIPSVSSLIAALESSRYPLIIGKTSATNDKGVFTVTFDITVPVLISNQS